MGLLRSCLPCRLECPLLLTRRLDSPRPSSTRFKAKCRSNLISPFHWVEALSHPTPRRTPSGTQCHWTTSALASRKRWREGTLQVPISSTTALRRSTLFGCSVIDTSLFTPHGANKCSSPTSDPRAGVIQRPHKTQHNNQIPRDREFKFPGGEARGAARHAKNTGGLPSRGRGGTGPSAFAFVLPC